MGDDWQAIYGFRAAGAAMTEFPVRYPEATVVRLEHNYRSSPPILAVANQLMADAPAPAWGRLWSDRPGRRRPLLRSCFDEATQAEAVCDSVLAHREDGVALRRQAVLFRAGHHADMLELTLGRRRIPYVKYGGLRFVEAAHVKDLVALLRVLGNPWDELAWFRVLRLLEGVGAATARRVMEQLGIRRPGPGSDGEPGRAPGAGVSDPGAPTWPPAPAQPLSDPGAPTPLARLLAALPSLPAPAGAQLGELRRALADCVGTGAEPAVGAQVDRLVQWLRPRVLARYDAAPSRCHDLERLAEQAADAPDRHRFVSDLALDPPAATGDLAGPPSLDEDWLVLSTVHSAKGGEWDVVHVIHAADGMFPSDLATGDADSLAEERRLLYVAVTRARDMLEISVPLRYHDHRFGFDDRHRYAPMSRFLTPAVKALMEPDHAGPPIAAVGVLPAGGAGGSAVDAVAAVDALLAELWS